jgi:hypothetical protein
MYSPPWFRVPLLSDAVDDTRPVYNFLSVLAWSAALLGGEEYINDRYGSMAALWIVSLVLFVCLPRLPKGMRWSNVRSALVRLPRLRFVWPSEMKAADVLSDVSNKLKASDIALRSSQNSVSTLTRELWSERGKVAVCMLQSFGRHHEGLKATVRFIDYSDTNQADHIKGLLQGTTGWKAGTIRDDGSTLRRLKSNRIDVASGSPENAKAVADALNHGRLVGEPVDDVEIIDSADENIIVTIYPRSSMPQS